MLLARHLTNANITGTMPNAEARKIWLAFRNAHGWIAPAPVLTPPEANLKFEKTQNDKKKVATYGLALAPAITSGHNVCPASTKECRAGCVASSGQGRYPRIIQARIDKTQFLYEEPEAFMTLVSNEIAVAEARFGKRLSVRLNTFSDIPWETVTPWLFQRHSNVRFYDYSKIWDRTPPSNYTLCFSASERTTDEQILAKHAEGKNVAVVFAVTRTKPLPATFLGIPVFDGDKTDARHLDPQGVIVGLRAKGKMQRGTWRMKRPADYDVTRGLAAA